MASIAPSRLTALVVGALLALALCLSLSAPAAAEVEPNDDYELATGPLASGVTYTGLLDSDADIDIYFFYVTRASTEIDFTISDPTVGGGGVYVELDGSEGEEIAGVYVPAEDYDTLGAILDPGQYYLWVETGDYGVFDEAYEITTSGAGAGAFSSLAQVQAQCRTTTAAASKAQAALDRAKRRLKHALKSDSRGRKVKARHAVKVAKAKLKAVSAEKLSCSVLGY